jgi:hypothetical protein
MALKEYKAGTTFPGVIGRTSEVSKPAWPAPNRAKEGAPNVLFIVLDDTGFGHLGCYGSPIRTPNSDKQVGQGKLPVTVPIMYGLSSGITVGADPGSPVTPKYKPPFEFTGVIKRVRVDVSGESFEDQAARFKAMMARQ